MRVCVSPIRCNASISKTHTGVAKARLRGVSPIRCHASISKLLEGTASAKKQVSVPDRCRNCKVPGTSPKNTVWGRLLCRWDGTMRLQTWALLMKGQKGGGRSGQSRVNWPQFRYQMSLARLGMGEGERANTSAGSRA